jgi:hypothetical protein
VRLANGFESTGIADDKQYRFTLRRTGFSIDRANPMVAHLYRRPAKCRNARLRTGPVTLRRIAESTQFNVVVPNSLTNREQPIVARYRGLTTQGGTLLSVQQ